MLFLLILSQNSCTPKKDLIEIQLSVKKNNKDLLLEMIVINNSKKSFYFPDFSALETLEFIDIGGNSITDTCRYLSYHVSGPTKLMLENRKRQSDFYMNYQYCFDYDSIVKYKEIEVNSVAKNLIDLEFKINPICDDFQIIEESKICKNYLLSKYCPLLIIHPGKSALFYINLADIMRVFKKIKIVSTLNFPENAHKLSFDLINDHLETDNFRYAIERINNYEKFNDIAISDTIIISTE